MPARSKPPVRSPAANFNAAVGERRGLTDQGVALARLNTAERELERAQLEAGRLQVELRQVERRSGRAGELITQQACQLQERDAELGQSHCYQAPERGVAPGHRPGVSNSWLPCTDDEQCPQSVPLPRGLHPVA